MSCSIPKNTLAIILILSVVSLGGTYSGGNGQELTPYLISSPADWQELMASREDWSSHFILIADIDLAGMSVTPVGRSNFTPSFTGIFDGDGYIIVNAVINLPSSNYIGLFGLVGSGGAIRNLGAEDIEVAGHDYVGGLVGVNVGSVTSCYATSEVTGRSGLGSLCGYNTGIISQCYATGVVTGGDVGGLCGGNSGTISQCYATGAVTGDSLSDWVGGLCGDNSGTISQCYTTGEVTGSGMLGGLCGFNYGGTVTDSLWDTEVSGQTISAAGTGKTTAEMKNINTFLGVGWDFLGEAENGTEDNWWMITNRYPIHSWAEPFALDIAELTMIEGETIMFEVVLPDIPTAEVALDLFISGYGDFELLTASTLIFNAGNWHIPQVVRLLAEWDDNYLNDWATLIIQSRGCRTELPLLAIDIQPEPLYEVILVSNDEVIVQEGSQSSLTVRLVEDPLGPVEIDLTISGDPHLSIYSDTVLFFDSSNYDVPQTVTVKSRWDAQGKDAQAELVLSSPDLPEQLFKTVPIVKQARYEPYEVLLVSNEEIIVHKGIQEASFTVMLAEDPLGLVEIDLTISGDPHLSIYSDTVLFFDSSNYDIPQTVTVESQGDGRENIEVELLLSSPDLPEQLFKTVTIHKMVTKPFRLSKPPVWLDAIEAVQETNVSHLGGLFTHPSEAASYAFRVTSVPGVPAVPRTYGHYSYISVYRDFGGGWEWRLISVWVSGTPRKPGISAKNRARITFTSDPSQTASVWVAIYEQADSGFKLVKVNMLKKSKKFRFVKKADVEYCVRITPAFSDFGSYNIDITMEAIR